MMTFETGKKACIAALQVNVDGTWNWMKAEFYMHGLIMNLRALVVVYRVRLVFTRILPATNTLCVCNLR